MCSFTHNRATAHAFHDAVVKLAAACGPQYVAATNSLGAALLLPDGSPAASSTCTTDPAEALRTLRATCICLGILRPATVAQHQRLISLYNHPLATRTEKRALLDRLHGLRADVAEQLYADFRQELLRREAGQYQVVGEAYAVPRPAAA